MTVFGIDTGSVQRQLNTIKPTTVGIARIMARVAGETIMHARQTGAMKSLPGDTSRMSVQNKIQGHADALAKLPDPNAAYQFADDLKKLTLSAFVEANATEEGAGWIDNAWSGLWSEIAAAISAQKAAQAAIDAQMKLAQQQLAAAQAAAAAAATPAAAQVAQQQVAVATQQLAAVQAAAPPSTGPFGLSWIQAGAIGVGGAAILTGLVLLLKKGRR